MDRHPIGRRQFVTAAAGAGLSVLAAPQALAETPQPTESTDSGALRLTIMPSLFVGTGKDDPYSTYSIRGVIRFLRGLRTISVGVRNTTREVVNIWDEDSSWGFHNLHLEVTAMSDRLIGTLVPLDKPIVVARTPMMGWSSNLARACPIPPGEVLVRNVELAPPLPPLPPPPGEENRKIRKRVWTGSPWLYLDFPMPGNAFQMKIQMRAVLTIPEDGFATRHKVWTGRIVSPLADYMIPQEIGSTAPEEQRA